MSFPHGLLRPSFAEPSQEARNCARSRRGLQGLLLGCRDLCCEPIRLAEAAEKASEGERRAITDIQESVNALLLEVLERLPRSVRSFERDMDDCRDIIEPKFLGIFEDFEMPLEMMISRQQQRELFCNVPLVMDFLKWKFALSLPRLRDPKEVLADSNEILHLSRGGVE
ncbi:unnamed protein product [Ectocarpus sp. CCAP 1310/34]|nr:unnamed protein product [Ectocarpus sp. CCAP 1310/34]